MGLIVYWYDIICFGLVGVALFGSIYVIWRREGAGKCGERTAYESLVETRREGDQQDGHAVGMTPRGHVSSTQLWISCWRGLHPLWLLALRFACFVITTAFLAWDILANGLSVYIYYTEWTFTLVIVYFATATIVSANGCMFYYSKEPPDNGQSEEFLRRDVEKNLHTSELTFRAKKVCTIKLQSHYDQETSQQRAGFWGYLMQVSYQTCAGAVILTDLVFWGIIVPFLPNVHLRPNMLMGCMHTLNAVFLLLDTAVNSLPFPWFRLAYFVLWSCCYVIFQWVIHACGYSLWPYPFLVLSSPWAPLWYLCMAVAHIPCYGLYTLLVRGKNSIFSSLFPGSYVKSF